MIRKIEEKDIPVILDWYNWYISNSIATFETEEISLEGFKQMIDIARKSGYKNIISLVTAGNIASEKLHERFGFMKKATFEDIGYKHNQWLAVSYYYLQLEGK